MIIKSPYRHGDVKSGVVKQTPNIFEKMKGGAKEKGPLPGTYCRENMPRPSRKHFWSERLRN